MRFGAGWAVAGRQVDRRTLVETGSGQSWASPATRDPVGSSRCSAWELLEDFAGDVALEGPDDLGLGSALGEAALHVGDGALVALAEAGEDDPPEGVVGLAVAAVVEAVPSGGLAGAGVEGCDAADLGERGFGADPSGTGPKVPSQVASS
jgi:hypothetical protein